MSGLLQLQQENKLYSNSFNISGRQEVILLPVTTDKLKLLTNNLKEKRIMKKSYLMIAAAALFAACASNDSVKEIETQESAIAFNQVINKTTRAYIGSKANLAAENGFVVYGYKTKDNWTSISQTVFNGTNVKSTDEGVNWYYDNLRFWDKTGKYNFYAVAPYGPSAGTYSINSTLGASFGYITITGATSAKNADSDDFLLARGGVLNQLGSAHTANSNAAVQFNFHHVMTKVQVKLKSTLNVQNGTIKVTRLKITGWNSNTGTFAQNSATNPTTLENSEWTIATQTPLAGDFTLVGTGCTDTYVEIPCDNTSAAANTKTVQDFCIMVPQNIDAQKLTFTLDYTYYHDENATHTAELTDDYNEVYENQEAVVAAAQTWGTDSYIIYTLDVKPISIDFTVDQICGFDAYTENYGPYNVE